MKALLIVYDRMAIYASENFQPHGPDEGFILTRDMDIVEDGFAF